MTVATYNFLIRLHVLLVVLLFLCCLTLARPLNSSGKCMCIYIIYIYIRGIAVTRITVLIVVVVIVSGSDGRTAAGNMASENSNAKVGFESSLSLSDIFILIQSNVEVIMGIN